MENREKELLRNYGEVKSEIDRAAEKAGRKPDEIQLVAVSKFHPASDVEILFKAGHRVFGESYVQEAVAKSEELSALDIEWHFIGGLQSKKAKYVAGNFSLVHSVDSSKLAGLLNKKAVALGVKQNILLQVNSAGEEQKSGVSEKMLQTLAEEVMEFEGLELQGLMCLPPFFGDSESSRPYFRRLRELKEKLEKNLGISLPHLSMGMTDDYVSAIEEGATMVRIGTRIFGKRPV
jgi:hypothetical protein